MPSPHRLSDPYDPGAKFALVVDDVPLMRKTLAALLTEVGYLVITACDGDEAVDTAPLFPFSVIVTDLEMPRMHGLDAVRRIRRMGGRLAEIPVILFSGTAMPPGEEEWASAGANALILKGSSSLLLLRTIDRLTQSLPVSAGWSDGNNVH